MTQRIAILIPYFGPWPAWIDFFLESCRTNRTIDWFIFNDAEPPANRPPNVRFLRTTFEDYKALLSKALGIRFTAKEPYKLCEIRPALAYVHRDLVGDYDFVGYGDLDVIYGDIRSFYDDAILGSYDLLSSHRDRVSGHFCLMRNTEEMITAFKRKRGWKRIFEQPDYFGFDESGLYRLFNSARAKLAGRLGIAQPRCLFREAYSTPTATHHMRWFWKDGQLTNEFYPHHPFMYLHFMSWHSSRWYEHQPHVAAGADAPWARLDRVVQIDWTDAARDGFMISPDGIQSIKARGYS